MTFEYLQHYWIVYLKQVHVISELYPLKKMGGSIQHTALYQTKRLTCYPICHPEPKGRGSRNEASLNTNLHPEWQEVLVAQGVPVVQEHRVSQSQVAQADLEFLGVPEAPQQPLLSVPVEASTSLWRNISS